MDASIIQALAAGSERVAAWADLLDEINVFPVADGDTGRNLKISLSPLAGPDTKEPALVQVLIESATGNSGNIAAAFFARFLFHLGTDGWRRSIAAGRQAAWQAVAEPKPGTMLTVFDALDQTARGWTDGRISRQDAEAAVTHMEAAVRSSVDLLPELRRAGVVDAGALGMFIFFEGFLLRLAGEESVLAPVTGRFEGLLKVSGGVAARQFPGYCVNTIIRGPQSSNVAAAAGLGDSVVAVADGDRLRLHLHTQDRRATRARLERLGEIVAWQESTMSVEAPASQAAVDARRVHVMTDAAGSLTRSEARQLGVTLLDSYLVAGDRRVPETLFDAQELYRAMAAGRRVSTAQASDFEKRQSYQSVLERYGRVLYLAVGSVYTGNFATACRWGASTGVGERFKVLDTGAASGRLGLIVRMVARAARSGLSMDALLALAHQAIDRCGELVFLNQLKFLAAGGRISKSRGFFGDLMGIKPVISPAADGAAKVGSVRKSADQAPFALRHLRQRFSSDERLTVLLQFSDNEPRVREVILPAIERQFPQAEIEIGRLSLTSGAHMGPGTWGVAYCGELPPSA